jgi:hypothetical protein
MKIGSRRQRAGRMEALAMGRTTGGVRGILRGLWTAAAAGVLAVVGAVALPSGPAAAGFAEMDWSKELDKIILRNGRVIEGEILSETSTEVRINVILAGISAPATYPKADILEIIRGERVEDAGEGGEVGAGAVEVPSRRQSDPGTISASADAPTVYVIRLEGLFGRDITPTPVRQAVEAARREQPDFLVIQLNNTWGEFGRELPNDAQTSFDWFEVADQIEPILTREIEQTWEQQPQLIFWVRNAMGGAAFLPLIANEIYFHPEGRMGGIGSLEQMFQGVGDEVVRQKQRSLRLARAQGLAIAGGYDYRLVTAMARKSYVLSYDIFGNLFERMPENPGEFVLTDDGKDDRADTMRQLVTGEGDDVLTLRADTALKLGVSKGTAGDLNEVLEHLGILRNHVLLPGRSDQILKSWTDNVNRAERQIPRLWEDFGNVQGGTTPREVRQSIGTRIRILEEMQNLYRRYGEAFNPFAGGVPNITRLDLMIEELKIQLMLLD